MKSYFLKRTTAVVIYAAAMAYLESATVVYLQRALAIKPGVIFPLHSQNSLGGLAGIEVGREIATLVMLVSVGWIVGKSALERLAWTAVAFGVWDMGYYFFLWIFIGWPKSLGTYDLLFLIPVPWVGPVWAPVVVSIALILFGLHVARRARMKERMKIGGVQGILIAVGGLVVVFSFTLHFRSIINGAVPTSFPWPIFATGLVVAVASATSLF